MGSYSRGLLRSSAPAARLPPSADGTAEGRLHSCSPHFCPLLSSAAQLGFHISCLADPYVLPHWRQPTATLLNQGTGWGGVGSTCATSMERKWPLAPSHSSSEFLGADLQAEVPVSGPDSLKCESALPQPSMCALLSSRKPLAIAPAAITPLRLSSSHPTQWERPRVCCGWRGLPDSHVGALGPVWLSQGLWEEIAVL